MHYEFSRVMSAGYDICILFRDYAFSHAKSCDWYDPEYFIITLRDIKYREEMLLIILAIFSKACPFFTLRQVACSRRS